MFDWQEAKVSTDYNSMQIAFVDPKKRNMSAYKLPEGLDLGKEEEKVSPKKYVSGLFLDDGSAVLNKRMRAAK